MINNPNILTTWIDGLTNDYVYVNGIIQRKSNLLTEVYARIVTPLSSYLFDQSFGSQIPLWINQRKQLNSDMVVSELLRCTQIMVNQNRAKSITARLTAPLTKNAVFFLVTITDNSGINVELDSNYISIPS